MVVLSLLAVGILSSTGEILSILLWDDHDFRQQPIQHDLLMEQKSLQEEGDAIKNTNRS
jgi:hypothetical protein